MPANRSRDRLRITHELRPHFEDAFTSIHLLPRGSGHSSSTLGHRSRGLDPWVKGPLLGLSKVPLHRRTSAASCPRRRPEGLPRLAVGSHSIRTFRPCRSSRLRRFSPHLSPRVCCTSQPIMGFARFWETLLLCRFRTPRCVLVSSLPAPARSRLKLRFHHIHRGQARSMAVETAPISPPSRPFQRPLSRTPSTPRRARGPAFADKSARRRRDGEHCSSAGLPPLWRNTLRSFSLNDSLAASPRSVPPCRCSPQDPPTLRRQLLQDRSTSRL